MDCSEAAAQQAAEANEARRVDDGNVAVEGTLMECRNRSFGGLRGSPAIGLTLQGATWS